MNSWRKALSGITNIAMLGQEKFVEQTVHLQQTLAVQMNSVAVHGQKAPILQRLERRGEAHGRVDTEFLFEISATDMTELELQDKFANQPLILVRRQCAIDRQLS